MGPTRPLFLHYYFFLPLLALAGTLLLLGFLESFFGGFPVFAGLVTGLSDAFFSMGADFVG